MKTITKTFDYTPVAQQGDGYLRRKFARIRQAQREQAEAAAAAADEAKAKTVQIRGRKS
jgi:hypothetical protein